MTPDQKRALKQAQLTAARALAKVKEKPDAFGIERFGEDKWVMDDASVLALMTYAIARADQERADG